MNAIILEVNKYKNNDAIIKCVSEHGIYDFLAKGVFKLTSANAVLNNPFLFIDLEFLDDKYKYPILKRFSILENPLKANADLTYFSTLLISNEVLKKCLSDEEKGKLYFFLLRYLRIIKNSSEIKQYFLSFLLKILEISGYGLDLNSNSLCDLSSSEKECLKKCDKNRELTSCFYDDEPQILDQVIFKLFVYFEDCFDIKLYSTELFIK